MAGPGPEGWFSFEALEKYGFPGGIILGAVILAIAIKRGWVFIGDRTKLAVKLAIAEIELTHEREANADLRKQLEHAQSLLTGEVTDEEPSE